MIGFLCSPNVRPIGALIMSDTSKKTAERDLPWAWEVIPEDGRVHGSAGSLILICPVCGAERFRNIVNVRVRPDHSALWETCWNHPECEMKVAYPRDYKIGGIAWVRDHHMEASLLIQEYLGDEEDKLDGLDARWKSRY
jgi:hypothetical protein